MDRVPRLLLIAALFAVTPASARPTVVGTGPDVGFSLTTSTVSEGAGALAVEVLLSTAAAVDITVPFSVSGSADAADASVPESSVVILAGQTSGSIDVGILDDGVSEGRERVVLTLGAPSAGQVGQNPAHEIVIEDDEPGALVTFDLASQTAGEASGLVTIDLTLSAARTEDASVGFGFSGAAVSGGVDFDVAQASPLLIPAGSTSARLDVSLLIDGVDEPDEDAVVSLLSADNCALGTIVVHTLTITDDDEPPAVEFAASASSMVEAGGPVSQVVRLSSVSAFDVTVPITASGTAVEGADFTLAPSSLLIPSGQIDALVDITAVDDSDVEGTEFFTLSLGAPLNATLGATRTHDVVLIDDDAADPLVEFTAPASSHDEGAGAVGVELVMSDYAAQPVTVELVAGGSATPGDDYALESALVVIPVGSLSATALLTLVDDADDEGDETVVLDLVSAAGATAGPEQSHVLTIVDDDAPPTIEFVVPDSTFVESAGTVVVEVQLSDAATSEVTVPLIVSGTAEPSGIDVTVAPDPLVLSAGESSGQFTVTIEPDLLHEEDETLQLELGALVGAEPGSQVSHVLTIEDDDDPPVVQFTAFRTVVAEQSGGFDVRVELDAISGLDVTVPFTVSGNASGSDDLSYPPEPILIPAGESFADLPVTLVKDQIVEVGDRVLFTLEAPGNATLGPITSYLVAIEDVVEGGLAGLAPPLTASVDSLVFPATRMGESSSPQTVIFSNLSSSSVTLVDLDGFGPGFTDFEFLFPGGLPAVVEPGQSASVEVSFRPQARGERTARIRSRQALPGALPPLIELSGLCIGPTGGEIQMDTSSSGWISPEGVDWSAEYGATDGFTVSFDYDLGGTDEDELFQSVRFGPSFGYSWELPNGAYEVVLRSFEPSKDAVGERVFDVLMEGQPALDGLDLFAEAGRRTAYVSPPLPVTVTDGTLDLRFVGVVNQALVSAIEVRSIAVLSSPTTSLQFGTVDQGSGLTLDVEFHNDGLHSANLDRLTFRVGAQGTGSDFSVEWNGVTHGGDVQTVVRFPNIELLPGHTTVPVTFAPTAHQEHEITLEFESTATGEVFDVTALGTGGAQAGWGFLHPVPDYDPRFVVDYDQDGLEEVRLLGAESHTHEPGRSLISYEWSVDGAPVATSVDTTQSLALGENLVALTVGDDNAPQLFATDTRSITVHPVDRVPGVLVRYYDGAVLDEVALLDAVPARPSYVGRSATLAVQPGDGTIGDSPFTGRVMLTMEGQFTLDSPRTLGLVASGGAGHRLFVDGQPVLGPQTFGAGIHTLEARFAVTSLGDLPVSVSLLENGAPALDIESSMAHDERAVEPVIHAMPTLGTDLGGNRIVIEGFGFFPESTTVVHWGSTDLTSGQFDEWRGEAITLTTPPGTGTVQVTVETPNGISNAIDFSYSPSGPVPIRFDLLTDREVALPSVTSGAFGPDGKLYVSRLTGEIHVITFDEDYNAISVETKPGVSGLTNHDTLSVAFNPFDVFDPQDPSTLRLYVGHGEQFQNGGGAFTGPSYFTGQISILSGPDFDAPAPLITHLPVSNHDHSIDGMSFDENGDLIVSVGGNTNAGVKWPLLGDVPESPLSGAVLRARISRPDFNGEISYVDSVTQVPVDDQVLGGQVDVVEEVDIEVLASGLRHAYDLVVHTNGYVYATDNGPNSGYGPASTGLTTDAGPVHPYEDDELNLIEPGLYYGSANRARGRYDARELIYRPPGDASIPGVYRRPMTLFDSSTNGIDEYRATAFNSAMRGDLIAMKWNTGVYRVELSSDGREVAGKTLYSNGNNQTHLPNRGLDVLAGPGGAIVAVDYSLGKVRVQVPNDIATLGLTPYDIFPWRVPATGGQRFVIGGSGFVKNLQQAAVTIGGVAATVTSVTDKRIEGIFPPSSTGLPTDLLDVVVTVGLSQRTIPDAVRYLPAVPGLGRGVWRSGVPLPAQLGEVACAVVGGELLVFGQGDARTFAFDALQGAWSTDRAPRPLPGNHHGVEVLGDKVYLLGGLDGGSAGQVQIYDAASDSWSVGAPMPWNGGSCVTAMIEGLIYVGGGNLQGAGTASNFAVYDPAADTWTSLGSMPLGVNHAAAGTDGARLFVFGGRQGANVPQAGFSDVQVYDPIAGTWETSAAGDLSPMPLPRGGTGRAVFAQGEFYVIGGEDDVDAFADVQVYDPVADSWRIDRPLPTARHGIYPALFEGRIFVFGGGLAAGFGFSDVSEVLSPR